MLPLDTPLPEFSLPDTVSGRALSSRELGGSICLLAILCNHCPYVVHIRKGLAELGRFCEERGVRMVGISVNDATTHPEDGPEKMKEVAKKECWTFPYLYDASQDIARALRAQCTPEFYVFDAKGLLAYRGQMDASRPSNDTPVTGSDIRAAVQDLLDGKRPSPDQKASAGCSIKWKPSWLGSR